ncbi:hypothetical protein AURDEDRAFT_112832 [Auricularia subglabra TFB-10046 SS5]|nr:hypothetical protein AURDEDRAFT_112832 [Auricularia subglabra TFB-10046 SS5]
MKFISIVALAVAAVAAQRDPAVLEAVAARAGIQAGDGSLTKRACTPSSCNCSGYAPGLFCGDGVLSCVVGHVYQCSTDGHTTCDYGIRTSCQQCNKLSC